MQKLLAPLMLRRVKQDVEGTLLPKIEINLYLPLTAMQVHSRMLTYADVC
jgi:SWI/SNF-related matrix-associated actin-dependent regulator of chromatin subfamily A member 5